MLVGKENVLGAPNLRGPPGSCQPEEDRSDDSRPPPAWPQNPAASVWRHVCLSKLGHRYGFFGRKIEAVPQIISTERDNQGHLTDEQLVRKKRSDNEELPARSCFNCHNRRFLKKEPSYFQATAEAI